MALGKKTGGRSAGIPNKDKALRDRALAASGKSPMEFLLGVMRDSKNDLSVRIDAAKAVCAYVHPKLAQVEHGNKDGAAFKFVISNSDAGLL